MPFASVRMSPPLPPMAERRWRLAAARPPLIALLAAATLLALAMASGWPLAATTERATRSNNSTAQTYDGFDTPRHAKRLAQRIAYRSALDRLAAGDEAGFERQREELASYVLAPYLDYHHARHQFPRLSAPALAAITTRHAAGDIPCGRLAPTRA